MQWRVGHHKEVTRRLGEVSISGAAPPYQHVGMARYFWPHCTDMRVAGKQCTSSGGSLPLFIAYQQSDLWNTYLGVMSLLSTLKVQGKAG